MAKKEEEGRLTPRPLTDTELDELVQLYEGGIETVLEWRAAALAAHPFLLAEVREGRRLLAEARPFVLWGGGYDLAKCIDALLEGNAAQPPTDP